MMDAVLELSGVVKSAGTGRAVLRMADFIIAEGERVGIYGLSDDERVVLTGLIGGLEDPDEGKVTVLGHELQSLNDRERAALRNQHIGYASHEIGFRREMTVLQNIVMPLSIRGMSFTERRKLGLSTLDEFGLAYMAFAYPRGLSLFETRLAALARAVITVPELLVLDDIFAGLDEDKTEKLADTMNGLERRMGILILSGGAAGTLSTDRTIKTEYGRIVSK